jgi:hypothetical protein
VRRLGVAPIVGLLLVAAAGCTEKSLGTCDITARACQIDIYYRVLNLRGDGYDPFGGLPPVQVITEDDYRAMLLAQQAANAAKYGPSPWDKALELLRFTGSAAPAPGDGGVDGGANLDAGSSTIEDEVTHILAFYDPATKTVTVVSHPTQISPTAREEAMVTLAHELVHALQDREIDLNKQDFYTSDEYLAYDAVIEGDARFYEDLFTEEVIRMMGRVPTVAGVAMPDAELDYVYAHFDEAGTPLFASRYLMYPLGAKYEATAYRSGGNAAVRHAVAEAPIRTVGLLVGADGVRPPVGTGDLACPAPATSSLPTTGATAGWDQFGAVMFYSFLRGWGVDHPTAFELAQSWTGDFLRIQANADLSTTAVAWRLEFSGSVPASVATTLAATGELSAKTGTGYLEITATDSTAPLGWTPAAGCP